MKKKFKDLKSEAAIKFVIDHWLQIFTVADDLDPVINFYKSDKGKDVWVAHLDLRDFVKKRQPLTGVKKQLRQLVQGKRKKK
jgi:hypothetical protein